MGLAKKAAKKRKMALVKPQQARRDAAAIISNDVYARLKKEWEPRVQASAMGDLMIMILAYLHIDRRHTGEYIKKWISGFNEFGDAVNREGKEGIEGLKKILLDECKIDVGNLFEELRAETKQNESKGA